MYLLYIFIGLFYIVIFFTICFNYIFCMVVFMHYTEPLLIRTSLVLKGLPCSYNVDIRTSSPCTLYDVTELLNGLFY